MSEPFLRPVVADEPTSREDRASRWAEGCQRFGLVQSDLGRVFVCGGLPMICHDVWPLQFYDDVILASAGQLYRLNHRHVADLLQRQHGPADQRARL